MRISLFILLFLITGTAVVNAQATRLGEIRREGTRSQFDIKIESSDQSVSALANRAFFLHGAFQQVQNNPDITLQLRTSGNDTILFTARSGGGQYSGTVTGSNLQEATLRACDRVVEHVLGIPGFFAGRLALVGEANNAKQIFYGDLFFQRMRQMTNSPRDSLSPSLSPDARTILFTTYSQSGFPDIFAMDIATRQTRPFATYDGTNDGAAFSPDGNRVAMILSSSGNPELYVSRNDGRNPRRLTNNRSLEASPSWSPDGREIVFTSDSPGSPQLFRISADGGTMRRIPTNISRYCAEPSWNPRDPNLIVFTIAQAGGFQVALYDESSRSSKTLTQVAGDAVEPIWLNDGRHILYTVRNQQRTRLHIMDTVTGFNTALHSDRFGNSSQASFVMP